MPSEEADPNVQRRYEAAVQSLLAKVRQDSYALAFVLLGSLAHDTVWEKSDIDLMIVVQETKQKTRALSLVEDDINIHATVLSRAEFKKMMEGSVQSSFSHSLLIKGKLLWTRDETLEELWADRAHFGARDREIKLLEAGIGLLWPLPKAQKWLRAKRDPHYAFVWILYCVNAVAGIVTALAGEIAGREVIWQAQKHNPALFQVIYTDLMDSPKTPERLGVVLDTIEAYLLEHAPVLFQPVFAYLTEAGGVRSVSEIDHHFKNQYNVAWASGACEWLAEQGLVQKVSAPVRLTEKSRVDVDEAAYYYEGE